MNDDPLMGVPLWYQDIFPQEEFDGFYRKLGNHAVNYIERDPMQLVVTFDNLAEAGGRHYARDAWAAKFIADNGWSHLGVFAGGPTWFQDQRLIDYLSNLKAEGVFRQYPNVALAGTSMGAFGALAFAHLAPGSTVIAFSPQTTLDQSIAPWDRRFWKGMKQDWSLPYSDVTQHLDQVGKIYAVYDPYIEQDRLHIERIQHPNFVPLKAIGLGHKSAMVLGRMEQLKPVMSGAIKGTLTQSEFYPRNRDRKNTLVYRRNIEEYLTARGKEHRIGRFRRAFKQRRAAREA